MADSGWGEAYFLPGCFDLSLRLEADHQRWWRKAPSKNESLHCKPASPQARKPELPNEIDRGATGSRCSPKTMCGSC